MATHTIRIELSDDDEQVLAHTVARLQRVNPSDTADAYLGRMARKQITQDADQIEKTALEQLQRQVTEGVKAIGDRATRLDAIDAALEAIADRTPTNTILPVKGE
jgi:hypothetical protein